VEFVRNSPLPQQHLRLIELTNHLTLISVLGRISAANNESLLALDGVC